MRPEHWQQLDQLFHSALQLEPGERAALLDKECAGKAGLRHEVEALLAAHEEAGSFIEKPAFDVEARAVAEDHNQLSTGQTIGHYQIVSLLGAGGMGEVYLARDTKLARDVAIKALPDGFTNDPGRLARFEREAKLLASLNHPNIAAVYGFEETDGLRCIVLELVSGQTLAERIAAGPVPIEEALFFAKQIAEALEAAHDRGIIHRDLKPANVKITNEQNLKVLDFGLAKAFEDQTGDTNISESPTRLRTQTGVILGTAAYMSPEQASGKSVDKRTDVFSFGCVLFEMLTGKVAFEGETVSDILAAVIRAEPDWNALPPTTPHKVRSLLHRCLQKDPKRRLRDVGDARIEIEESLNEPADGHFTAVVATRNWRRAFPFALAVLAIGGIVTAVALSLIGVLGWAPRLTRLTVTRFTITLPDTEPLALTKFVPLAIGRTAIAISPDGANLVYVVNRNGTAMLNLRPLDQFEGKSIAGTEGAYNPFFSPDGKWVAFFADNKLKKVSLAGGEPVTLCEARNPMGAKWGANDTIFFGDQEGGLLTRIAATGGTPKVVPVTKERINEIDVLPDEKWLLYSAAVAGSDYAHIVALSLETGQRSTVLEGGNNPHYLSSGYLVFTRAGSVMAASFDLLTRRVTGPAVSVVEGVRSESYGNAQFAISQNGTLVFVSGTVGWIGKPVWVDRRGNITPIALPAQGYKGAFKLSPDGKRLAIVVRGVKDDIWVYEFERGTFLRLTVDGQNYSPVWSPDGKLIAFASIRNGKKGIFSKAADGNGAEELVASTEKVVLPESWSPDGRALSVLQNSESDAWDILIVPLEGDRKLKAFLRTKFSEALSSFSPDGHWMVYTSDESGRFEIYVRPYPGPGGKWQISTEGGEEPVWSADGRELFYRNGEKWMVASVHTKGDFSAETPRLLFEKYFINVSGLSHWPAPDGQRQVMIQPLGNEVAPKQINVVLNWSEELKQRVAATH